MMCLFSEEKARPRRSSFANWAVRTPPWTHGCLSQSTIFRRREESVQRQRRASLAPRPREVTEGMSLAGDMDPQRPPEL